MPILAGEPLATDGEGSKFLSFDFHHGFGDFLDEFLFLVRIENVFDEVDGYKWHGVPPLSFDCFL